jgi:RimJ/RimL family protein N-acetyltransferase
MDLVEEVELRDGRQVRVRPLLVEDEPAYRHFVDTVSDEAQYYRFFSPRRALTEKEIAYFVHVDYHDRLALVATWGDEIVGIARYDRERDPGLAEVAFILLDDFQGFGLAGRFLRLLAEGARRNGIHRFVASVLPDNHKMLQVFVKSGMLVHRHFVDGVVEVTLRVDPEPDADPDPAPDDRAAGSGDELGAARDQERSGKA